MNSILQEFELPALIIAGVLSVTFILQLVFYLGRYGSIATYRQKISNKQNPPVTVVVVLEDSLYYVEEVLPKLLLQHYDEFEVVVVDNGSSVEVVEALQGMMIHYPHLKYTRINRDPKFKQRRKLALTVGIKAASYPNIIFTSMGSFPTSGKWLSMMAKGFTTGDVVIGYCGIEPEKGLRNKLIRCSRMMTGIRYLSSAIKGKPYRGYHGNMGFTSKIYFDNKGYNHLRLNIGDDDLFIQQIATCRNTSIVINPKATTREVYYGGFSRWFSERRFYSYTYRYYPTAVKAGIFTELTSRTLFFVSAITLLAWMVPVLWIAAVVLLALRYAAVFFTVYRIAIRLGEKGLMGAFILHDLFSPLSEGLLSLTRRIRPSSGIWT